ncbi:unnamed protein product, partial [Musa acuminata var. zebrina]
DYHEYINVIARGDTCYVMDINLVAEFEIVKSTIDYVMLLSVIPTIFRHGHVHAVVKAKGVAVEATTAQPSHVDGGKLCTVDIGCKEMPTRKKKTGNDT